MKKFFAAILIGLSLVTFTLDASAARLGGGASFGRSMSIPKAAPSAPFKSPSAAQPRKPAAGAAAAGAAAKAPMSMGKRLLLGAAAALGFMALANMLGLGEGFAQLLMFLTIGLLALLAFKFFMGRKTATAEPSHRGSSSAMSQGSFEQPEQNQPVMKETQSFASSDVRPGSAMDQFSDAPSVSATDSSFGVPADFNEAEFLNMSTAYFKMLQKAWDSGDMDELANYCTDEFFIELTHKRREIKGANLTEILKLDAKMAGFETAPSEYVASVLFTGELKENGERTDLKEIWNLVKPREGKTGWLLAGIQQA